MARKAAAPYVIEVTVISAEGLRLSRSQPVKRNSYVVVRSDPFNSRRTGTDREGGGYPAWNEKVVMELPANARFLTVEAHSGSRLVGAAHIPVSDFAGGFLPLNYLSFLSYRLRDANGAKNGILNLSVKVKAAPALALAPASATCSGKPWGGVPAHGDHGIVTGIPVSYKC
ncbi:BON1-associated protein 2-like [Salvia miltiorrhiza]|uniref:BON1-associated protein 2-like n=1 Tax=Salvia miltiorrhiza TaxID=226208 RepID=UPI0025AB7089|nr:BON1-associated protein 2-like [Salvia miltiorrhiza]